MDSEFVVSPSELRILVVEDDDDARASLKDILELDAHRVQTAANAAEAFTQLEQMRAVDVIILDRKLPDGMAENLISSFRQSAPSADIVIVTGYTDLESTITAMREGASDYIIKPINPESLLQRLRRVAERRAIERQLHDERQFADTVLKTAEAIVLVLGTDGQIIRFNPYLAELCGLSLEDVQGCDWFETFIPTRDQQRIRELFEQTIRDVSPFVIVNPILTKAGDEREIRWSNTALRDENGEITGVLSIGLDVTEAVNSQQKLLQAERLAAIGQTMTGLAHESRNALQRMQNATDLLEDDLQDNPSALRDLSKIARACKDLRDLLDEVRDYAAPINLEYNRVSLPALWRQTWTSIESNHCDRQATLIETPPLPFPDDADRIRIDQRRMAQVFRNLFENALDACDDPVEIRIGYELVGDAAKISIQDNGPGMPFTVRDKIFDAFFTTKPTGTGLGLAIVYRIIEAHQGEIKLVDSHVGTRYEIWLPNCLS